MSDAAAGAKSPSVPSILAIVCDLIFESKITGTAGAVGALVTAVRTREAVLEAVRAGRARALLIDLTLILDDPIEIVRAVRAADANLQIIGFFPHVQAELGRAARAAGATHVLVRSQFAEQLPDLLRQLSR